MLKKVKKIISDFIEEILYLISLAIFIFTMFKYVSTFVGLITLSIVIFIIATVITYCKSKRG